VRALRHHGRRNSQAARGNGIGDHRSRSEFGSKHLVGEALRRHGRGCGHTDWSSGWYRDAFCGQHALHTKYRRLSPETFPERNGSSIPHGDPLVAAVAAMVVRGSTGNQPANLVALGDHDGTTCWAGEHDSRRSKSAAPDGQPATEFDLVRLILLALETRQ